MPVFVTLYPCWIIALSVGIVLLFSAKLRYLSTYLILCSVGGLAVSITLPAILIVFLGHYSNVFKQLGPFFWILIGAVFGVAGGLLAARFINKWLNWTPTRASV